MLFQYLNKARNNVTLHKYYVGSKCVSYNNIKKLFEKRDLFAELVDEVDTRKFEFEEEWTTGKWKAGINDRIIIVKKSEKLDVQKAFALLFKYILLYWQDWKPEYVMENNELSSEKWRSYLKEYWFPEYFPERDLTLKKVNKKEIFKYVNFEVDPQERYKKMFLASEMIEIMGYNNTLYFGMENDVYFYLERVING